MLEKIPTYYETYIPADQMENNKAEVLGKLDARFKVVGVDSHVMIGHSANSILDWAEANDVDCIFV